jgi:hypothetical protein
VLARLAAEAINETMPGKIAAEIIEHSSYDEFVKVF